MVLFNTRDLAALALIGGSIMGLNGIEGGNKKIFTGVNAETVDEIKSKFQKDLQIYEGKTHESRRLYHNLDVSNTAIKELELQLNGAKNKSGNKKNKKLEWKEHEYKMALDTECSGYENKEDSVKCYLETLAEKYPDVIFNVSTMFRPKTTKKLKDEKESHIERLQEIFMDRDWKFDGSKNKWILELRRKYETRNEEKERLKKEVSELMRIYGASDDSLTKEEIEEELEKERSEQKKIQQEFYTEKWTLNWSEKWFLDIIIKGEGDSGLKKYSIDWLVLKFLVEKKLENEVNESEINKLNKFHAILSAVKEERKVGSSSGASISNSSSNSSSDVDESENQGTHPLLVAFIIIVIGGGIGGALFYIYKGKMLFFAPDFMNKKKKNKNKPKRITTTSSAFTRSSDGTARSSTTNDAGHDYSDSDSDSDNDSSSDEEDYKYYSRSRKYSV